MRKKIKELGLPDVNNSFYKFKEGDKIELHCLLIFVFGSNLAGRHGAGAAKYASLYHCAISGIGEGIQGGSYALPTKDRKIKTLPLSEIKIHIDRFLEFNKNKNLYFYVTAVGTGLAGYKHSEIAPMFKGAKRCWFPKEWEKYLKEDIEVEHNQIT